MSMMNFEELHDAFVAARQQAAMEWERRRTADIRFTIIVGKLSEDFRYMVCDRGREDGDKIVAKCKTTISARIVLDHVKAAYIKGDQLDGVGVHGPAPDFVSPTDRIPEGACCANEQRNMNGGCDNCGDPCL